MMDCKRALAACNGDLQKASDYLRKKGLVSADKKAGRIASEGAVVSYIHGGRYAPLCVPLSLPDLARTFFGCLVVSSSQKTAVSRGYRLGSVRMPFSHGSTSVCTRPST